MSGKQLRVEVYHVVQQVKNYESPRQKIILSDDWNYV